MSGTFPTTVYFDDFPSVGDYTHLNPLWSVYDSVGNAGNGFRKPAQVSIVGGVAGATSDGNVLQIKAQNVGGQHWSGGIQLNVPQTYGQYEMRCRCSVDTSQRTSGVWLLWPRTNRWPEEGELDYWETFGHRDTRTPVQSYVHRPNPTPETTVAYDHTGISQADWHKIVCNWTPDEISIGIDNGPQIMLTNNPAWIPGTQMQLCIQLDAWDPLPPTADVILQTDYVVLRSYSPVTAPASGLPRLGFNVPVTVAGTVTATDSTIPITPNNAMPTTGIYPVSLDLAGEMVTVSGASVSGPNLSLTGVSRSVNGVVRPHSTGDKVLMANPFKLAMGKTIGHKGRVIPPVNENFTTTAALVANVLAPGRQVIAWMPNTTAGSDTRRDANWELGQFNTSTNADTSPAYGFWYPNVQTGAPAYAHADYMFRHNITSAFSGTGYAETVIKGSVYNSSWAAQLWRSLDQNGNNLPVTNSGLYFSWRMRFHEAITYDNVVSGSFGFTNHWQFYRQLPSNSPFITLGAGKNLANDSVVRWHANLDNRASYDMTQVNTPAIPINQWIHMQVFLVVSDGTDGRTGRLKIWQDGVVVIDYTGPTIADYWEKFGVSWGNYGHLLGQDPVTIDYDEVLISTVDTLPRLILPQPAGGFG